MLAVQKVFTVQKEGAEITFFINGNIHSIATIIVDIHSTVNIVRKLFLFYSSQKWQCSQYCEHHLTNVNNTVNIGLMLFLFYFSPKWQHML